jgi:putative ABC transport system permease protein
MWTDHFQNALRSLKRGPVLTLLIVLALGLGIGACMTTLTVYRVLAADPIPGKSQRLFDVQIDAGDLVNYKPGEEPQFQLTRFDAETLLSQRRALRQTMTSGAHLAVERPGARDRPETEPARYATSDFFSMFNAPLAFGSGWAAQQDQDRARVVVIGAALNERLFGKGHSGLGAELLVRGQPFRVVGVLKPWRLEPYFIDLSMGAYGRSDQLILPFSTAMELELGRSGNMNCWGDMSKMKNLDVKATCSWVQYWVELEKASDAPAFERYLARYSDEQRSAGRFERPTNVRLRDVVSHLEHKQVLPKEVRLQTALALGFLLVCLVNMAGLMLAKTLRRSGEIGVRRALGASRQTVFMQFLVESALVGGIGALLGLLLSQLGLWLVRQSPTPYAKLAEMDTQVLLFTLAAGVLAALLAGLLPAWRAAHVNPATQIKVQ